MAGPDSPHEIVQRRSTTPLDPPSAEAALLLAHDILHPEDGGDHRPVKLASARSSRDTVELAAEIDAHAFTAARSSDHYIWWPSRE